MKYHNVLGRTKTDAWFEEKFDVDVVFHECTKPVKCALEEVNERHLDDFQQVSKVFEKYARQWWTDPCDAQGAYLCVNHWDSRDCKCNKS